MTKHLGLTPDLHTYAVASACPTPPPRHTHTYLTYSKINTLNTLKEENKAVPIFFPPSQTSLSCFTLTCHFIILEGFTSHLLFIIVCFHGVLWVWHVSFFKIIINKSHLQI